MFAIWEKLNRDNTVQECDASKVEQGYAAR